MSDRKKKKRKREIGRLQVEDLLAYNGSIALGTLVLGAATLILFKEHG